MKDREYYLSLHPYVIWKGSNGKWFTYISDKEGRHLRRRNSEEDMKNFIVSFYMSQEVDPYFNEVFRNWINEKLEFNEISKGTYDRYSNDYKRFFSGSDIDKNRIGNITEDELEIFIRKSIAEKGLTKKAYDNLRTLILGTFKYAKKKKFTQISISNFTKDLELSRNVFRKTIKNKEDQIYLEDEIPIVTDYLKANPSVLNLGLLLAFQTGIRTGELAALKPSDVVNNTIHIQRQEIKYKDAVKNKCVHDIVEFTKSDSGNRYVIVTENALDTIRRIRTFNPYGEFLMEFNGKRILTNSFNDGISRVCKSLNIRKKSMHKIRRTYGTTLLDNDVDESLIMAQMGHSDITTTRKYYYYSNKNMKSKELQIQKAIKI